MIDDVDIYTALDNNVLIPYLDSKDEESINPVNLSTFNEIVDKKLRVDMSNKNAMSGTKKLFVKYQINISRQGLSWLINYNSKVAVYHVLCNIHPDHLQSRLRSDLDFAFSDLKKDLQVFMKHEIRLSDAFKLVKSATKQKLTSQSLRRWKTKASDHHYFR